MASLETAEEKAEKKIEWGHHWIQAGFEALEAALAETAGLYCVADTITMADACLVPQVSTVCFLRLNIVNMFNLFHLP